MAASLRVSARLRPGKPNAADTVELNSEVAKPPHSDSNWLQGVTGKEEGDGRKGQKVAP